MSNRTRIILIGSIVVFLILIELSVQLGKTPKSCVEIVNEGGTPIENLIVSFAGSQLAGGNVKAGESVHIWLSGREKGTLSLAYRQQDNPMSGFQVPEYDPVQLSTDGLKLVLRVRTNEVERGMAEDESTSPLGRLRDQIWSWFAVELHLP